jgi:YD repeat-containing protein
MRDLQGRADKDVDMDLQADCSVKGFGGLRARASTARSRLRFLRTLFIGVLCILSLTCSIAWASTSYVYDANGRLVAVTADNGTSARYVYDEMGNIVSVDHVAAGELAIFAFSPTHGTVGTTVAIYGQGFSSTLSDNTVSFNGVAATVQSATPTQLITAVPDGADTGPISVTVSGRTATSSSPFVVDDTGLPPQITSVTPLLAAVGDTITVAGDHLQPTLGGTSVHLGGRPIGVSSISNAQIQFAVPNTAVSGYVVVDTPYGSATSPAPVIVLPSGIAPGGVVSEGYALTDGPAVSLNIPAAGGVGGVLFDASAGAWLSLQASDISTTASYLNYKVYAPGNVLVTSGTLSVGVPTVHLAKIPTSGTYVVVIQPDTAGAQLKLAVEGNQSLQPDQSLNVTTQTPGQSERVLFQASVGATMAFAVKGTTTSPTGHGVRYTIYTPDGQIYTSGVIGSTGLFNFYRVPSTGTYQAVISPGSGVTGIMQIETVSGVVGDVSINGPSQTYTANAPGQNVYLTFDTGSQERRNLELTLRNANVVGGQYNQFYVYIYDETGAQITSFGCNGSNPDQSCEQHLWYLPGGKYSVVVTPNYGGTIHFNALLQEDVIGPAVDTNGTANIVLGAGQVERLTFDATAGDTIALRVSGVATTPSGQPVTFNVFRPDAGAITTATAPYSSFSVTGSQLVNLSNLPVSGTYTVIVVPKYGLPASAQLSVVPGATGTIPVDGLSGSYSANVASQNVYLSFDTGSQDRKDLELTFRNISIAGSGYHYFDVHTYNQVGTQVAYNSCGESNPGGSCSFHLWYLPGGKYSVVVVPRPDVVVHFDALLQEDIHGPLVAMDETANLALGPGQVERLTFNATAGDTVALRVSGLATTPSGHGVTFKVYRPDTGAITADTAAYSSFDPTGTQTVNMPNLPVSGTYTVIVAPDNGLSASAQFSVVSGATGTIPVDGSFGSYSANVVSQNLYLSFDTGSPGRRDLELTFRNISIDGSGYHYFDVHVYNQVGMQVAYSSCGESNPGASCSLHLWYLPGGKYSVLVAPRAGVVVQFDALLQDDVVGPLIGKGESTNLVLGAGQVERLTFDAMAGDTVALQVSGVTTTPGGRGVTISVYRPDAGGITADTVPYRSFDPTGSQTVNLPNLPVSGAYTVTVAPDYGLSASAVLGFSYGGNTSPTYGDATLPSDGSGHAFDGSGSGQNIGFTFNAGRGDNLELTLTGIDVPGASSNGFRVDVYNPSGSEITSALCYKSNPGSSCRLALWNLVPGTYSVTVSPIWGGTAHFSAMVKPDVVDPELQPGIPSTVTLNTGEVHRLTFHGNAGDAVALRLSGVTTAPGNQVVGVSLYRPDTGAIGQSRYTNVETSTASTLNLTDLPATGTYTAVVYTTYGESASAQLMLSPGVIGFVPSDGAATPAFAADGVDQNVYFTFDANRGDNLELTLSKIDVTGASSNSLYIYVYTANGAQIGFRQCYKTNPAASCRLALWNMMPGTYSVTVTPYGGGVAHFSAMVKPDVMGPELQTGIPAAVTLAAGEVHRLTFHGSAGDTVALRLSGATTTPSGQPVSVDIYRPDTGAIGQSRYTHVETSTASTLNLTDLPATGTYTVVAYTAFGEPGGAQLMLSPGVSGSVPIGGSTVSTFAASQTGQNAYLTFNADRGDNLELTLDDIDVQGADMNGVHVDISNPSGTQIAGDYCYSFKPGAGCRFALWNLAPGTYSVTVAPVWGGVLHFSAMVKPDVIGPTLISGEPVIVTLNSGEVQRFTFHGNAGDTLALSLSGVTTTPAGEPVSVDVYRPDTGLIGQGRYNTLSVWTSNTLNMADLPVSGDYTAVVYTSYGEPGNAQLTLSHP